MLLQYVKEFFRPELKCERLGHCFDTVTRKIRKKPDYGRRVVVIDYKAKFLVCSRCRKIEGEPFDLKEIDWFSSCTMPESQWDEIREHGYLIL